MKEQKRTGGLFRAGLLFLLWLGRLPFKMAAERRQHRQAVQRPVSQALRDFAKVNASAWGIHDLPGGDSKQKVLIEGLNPHKAYLMTNLVIGSYHMSEHGLGGVGLLHEPNDEIEAMFRAYGIHEFHYLSDRDLSLRGRLRAGFCAFRMIAANGGVDDLLEETMQGVYVGKCVYDWYLRGHGLATVESYTVLFFAMLATGIGYVEYLSRLFSGGRFPVVVQAERQYAPEGIVCQAAVANGSTVYCRGGGPTSFSIFRITGPADFYRANHRYGRAIFEHVWQNYREHAVQLGGEFMADRFSGNVRRNDIPDASIAYAVNAGETRESLCERFGWDPAKPIVVVMGNMLNDGVFVNGWRLFRDNYVWIEKTVQTIADVNSVNWLVKAHPSDVVNPVKMTSRDVYEKWAGHCPHVQFYLNEWGSRALPGIVDAVLTVYGTAGIEYSSFGIPCVLAGQSMYSGLGFTHEPQTQEAYFETLRNIHTLGRLTPEQMERAKVYTYIYMMLSRVECRILPDVRVYADYDDEKYLRDAVALLERYSPMDEKLVEMIRLQVSRKRRHLLNYDYVGLDAADTYPASAGLQAEGVECR